jgi:sortase A
MVIDTAAPPDDEVAVSVALAEERTEAGPSSGPPRPGPLVVALSSVLALSFAAVFFAVFAFGLSGLQEQRSQHQLYAQLRGLLDPSSPVAPAIGGTTPQGFPIGLLDAPVAGIHHVVVVEGTSPGDLLAGPGHRRDTPFPGQVGDAILVGKGSTAGAPFRNISALEKGDIVTVRTGQGLFRYKVEDHRVAGTRLPSYLSDSGLLTLVSSAGSGAFGWLTPDHLVYVDARLVGAAVGAPHGRPRSVTYAEIQGHNDPPAWLWVILWLVALAAATGATWYLWSRWGILQTWLVGAPVILGILWALSDEAIRLLPNVY